jgi:hypothetical protein
MSEKSSGMAIRIYLYNHILTHGGMAFIKRAEWLLLKKQNDNLPFRLIVLVNVQLLF